MPRLNIPQYVAQRAPTGVVRGAVPGVVNVSGLVQGIDAFEHARQREQAEQDKSQASALLSTAELDWTKHELDSRKGYDPASGQPYAEEFGRRFDAYSEAAMGKVSSDGARRLVKDRLLALRTHLVGRAMEFEVGARAEHRRGQLETSVGKRAATAELDPSQAVDLMALQMAEIEGSADLSAIDRAGMRESAKGIIAMAALRTEAARNPAGIRTHPLLPMVPAQKLPELLRHAEKAEELVKAQGTADQIMTRGLPLNEAMQLIEREHQGEEEKVIKAEVMNRYAYAEAARRDQEEKNYGRAQLEVEQRGRVSPTTWATLTDSHRAAILNRQQAEARQRRMEAEGRPVKTDFGLYLDLREMADSDPAKFRAFDLRQHVDKIGPAQMEQLLDIKRSMAQAAQKPMRDGTTLTQQLNATAAALGIKDTKRKGLFLSHVQGEVDEATQAKGKPLTFEERQGIIDRAVLQGPDPDAWLWGKKRLFELTPEQRARFRPDALTDAPATEVDSLNEALRAQGLPETPANRLQLYQRAMSRSGQ